MVNFMIYHNPEFSQYQLAIMRTYIKSQSFTCHLRGGDICWWKGSLASGHPLTSIDNSILNLAYLMYSVWRAQGFPEQGFFDQYHKNIVARVMGDDNRVSVSPLWKDYVSEQIMADGYADFGHVYTSDTKDGINDHFRSFEETTFLKRFMRYEPILQKYIYPLRLDVVLEMPLWTRGEGKDNVPSEQQAISNADTMVRHLCYHDQETWDTWIPKFVKMYEEVAWQPKYMTREAALRAVFDEQERTFCVVPDESA